MGLDASRFDQHVSQDALKVEHKVWNRMTPGTCRPHLRRLLSMQLQNHGIAYLEGLKVKYTTDGCRMSGDMNTSSGNCMLMCLMLGSYLDTLKIKYRFANNGDDCVVIIDKRNLSKISNLQTWFLKMGFTMKVEKPVFEFEKIEFC